MEQRTDEWFDARLGKVTASKIYIVMAKGVSGKPSATRQNYLMDLLAERLTGAPASNFPATAAMQWGTDQEENARRAYSFMTDLEVKEVGFVDHPEIPNAGASPDGLVSRTGLVEIKCPNTQTHLKYLEGGSIDSKYKHQMNWQMACTGREWCDFMSFDPRAPDALSIKIERIYRCDETIKKLEKEVEAFLEELDQKHYNLISITEKESEIHGQKRLECE